MAGMPTHAPAYFPGSPPGADPFFDFEAMYAAALGKRVSYPLAYDYQPLHVCGSGCVHGTSIGEPDPSTWWAE